MELAKPYLLFLGDVHDQLAAKTAQGIVDWRPDWCVGQLRLEGCNADCGIEDVTIAGAVERGARTMVVGVVNSGGVLPDHWITEIVAALDAGMDVATGLHKRLSSIPEIAAAAKRNGRHLHDVRFSQQSFATGKGNKRPGLRLLAVGTDCSVGKKYTALALDQEMRARAMKSEFCATGQTGVFISSRGVAIDAVIADFISGAAEWLTPDNEPDAWQVVEGQGSLFHPAFAAVTLGLLHGSQPDAFVVCHEPTRTNMRGVKHPLPTIQQVMDMTVVQGSLTNPDIRCVGICVNTSALPEDEARSYLEGLAAEHGLPATDPIRFGSAGIVDELQKQFGG
ncbi:MAG: N-acetyltransferase DgcN [Pseudomonadota bacterium]